MTCPVCRRCPFEKGVCEDRVNRGRRFFLVGALALPVARTIARVAPPLVGLPVAPVIAGPTVTIGYQTKLYAALRDTWAIAAQNGAWVWTRIHETGLIAPNSPESPCTKTALTADPAPTDST